jgi:hypothetical protein
MTDEDLLRQALEARERQVTELRAALADVISELARATADAEGHHGEAIAQRERADAVEREAIRQRDRAEALERERDDLLARSRGRRGLKRLRP